MEYLWLLMVGVLMAAYQALWWILIGGYLLIGLALFITWDMNDRELYDRPHWTEVIVTAVVVILVWPIIVFTRRAC